LLRFRLRAARFGETSDGDLHATLAETKPIYANANEPKEIWIIPGAHHQDFYRLLGGTYERRVLDFLKAWLRG
jgi:fermentation-respiration switch protein FrsA (DUF1100 family)